MWNTGIIASTTQEYTRKPGFADIGGTVRTRAPFVAVGVLIAIVLFFLFGGSGGGALDPVLDLTLLSRFGSQIPVRDLVVVTDLRKDRPIFHKNLLRVSYVMGDVTGLPRLVDAMRAHGYDEPLIRKLAHENWIAVLERTWGE